MLDKIAMITLLSVALTAIGCSSSPTDTFAGTVTRVHDGDSIHITPRGEKRVIIRLAGIDAPELAQPFGIASRDKLRALILETKAEAVCHKTDRYQRQVCVVFHNDKDINLEMLRGGLAWHYKQYQNEQSRQRRKEYARAERKARQQQQGLWSGDYPVEPWEFRKVN